MKTTSTTFTERGNNKNNNENNNKSAAQAHRSNDKMPTVQMGWALLGTESRLGV